MRKLFEEERRLGWMVEVSDKEAQEACGEKLSTSLAVVIGKDRFRLVQDATNKVQVNNRIVRDQARSPDAGEMRTLPRERAVIGDASEAYGREGGLGVPSLPTGTGPSMAEHRGDLRFGFSRMLLGTTGQWRGGTSLLPSPRVRRPGDPLFSVMTPRCLQPGQKRSRRLGR